MSVSEVGVMEPVSTNSKYRFHVFFRKSRLGELRSRQLLISLATPTPPFTPASLDPLSGWWRGIPRMECREWVLSPGLRRGGGPVEVGV